MSKYDIDSLLSEVSSENPCGEDISYDSEFLDLERLLQSNSGGMFGDETEAEEPNWSEFGDKAFSLLRRSKDLRLVTYLILALLMQDGFSGLRDGAYLLRELLERYWDNLHPNLDPDDNNDPLERINILSSLSPDTVSDQDPMKFRRRTMEIPLCNSRQIGKFSYRDIEMSRGGINVSEGQTVPDIALIEGAFQDSDLEFLEGNLKSLGEAIENLAAAMDIFSERAYQSQSPNLSDFTTLLKNIKKYVQTKVTMRTGGVLEEESVETASVTASVERDAVNIEASVTSSAPISGEIRTSKEAMIMLDKVCAYFERNEPSSPVPLLLRRAKKLVSRSFLEIIEDFCPDAISQIELISGKNSDSEDSED